VQQDATIQDKWSNLWDKKSTRTRLSYPKNVEGTPTKRNRTINLHFNGIIRTSYWPKQFKFSQLITIVVPGKDSTEIALHHTISLLSVLSKVLEKLVLRQINKDFGPDEWIPHQFGFRQGHSTVQQIHCVTKIISKALEDRKYCAAVFPDVNQAIDRVRHSGLLYKIKQFLPPPYFHLLKCYLSDRQFQVRVGNEKSELQLIKTGVPQGSVFGPTLYVLYTSDLPTSTKTTLETFADDTVILSVNENSRRATSDIQHHLNTLQTWFEKWRIRINENKSCSITFTLRKSSTPDVTINDIQIPQKTDIKFLGMTIDSKLTWKHIIKKRKQVNITIKQTGY
jgi:hypothetical protein